MKITSLGTQLVNLPLANPIHTAIHNISSLGCVLLSLETDQGHIGQSYVFTINAVRLKAFDEMIKGFGHQLIGKDPHYTEAIWQSIWAEINPTGHKGVTISALSAIDTACWDIVGKAADKPLHQLFGACRDRVRTYASSGLWLSMSIDALQQQAQDYLDMGFRAMKIRLGSPKQSDDVQRVQAVRNVVGDDIDLMVDINQALDAKTAIQLGRKLEKFALLWIEEPVPAYDLQGHAAVRQALDTHIASGETEYTRFGMQAMIEKQACDILMPDLQRMGGLTEMRRVAALAASHNIPISTHIFTEQSLCIAGSSHNCLSVEHMDWFSPLFNEQMQIDAGDIVIPDRPGTGFTFNQAIVNQHTMR